MNNLIIITSVKAEAHAIGFIDDCTIEVVGIGRANAAATTEVIVRNQHCKPFGAVNCAGIEQTSKRPKSAGRNWMLALMHG